MAKLNNNYLKLKAGYLFPEIGRRVKSFSDSNPEDSEKIIRCGIGDVTEPLPLAARDAMKSAVDELGSHDTFRGYGPEQGYEFLRCAIANGDYRSFIILKYPIDKAYKEYSKLLNLKDTP